jgi:hypothetical protein
VEKVHNEEFNDRYYLPGFWWGNVRERDHLADLGVDGKIILRWIFMKWHGRGMD